jgi:NDP-sugar pyrophosphorylase family protein
VDHTGQILRFSEKSETQGPGWINAGVYLLSREFIESIPGGQKVSLEHQVFPKWIGRGLLGFGAPGRFWDIGVPDAYVQANADFCTAVPGVPPADGLAVPPSAASGLPQHTPHRRSTDQ